MIAAVRHQAQPMISQGRTLAETKAAILNDVVKVELLLRGITGITLPCPHVYGNGITPCPYCSGKGSIRYDLIEVEFQGDAP